MGETCKLFCVTETELNLKTCTVEFQHFLTCQSGVVREKQLALTIGHMPDDKTDLALQGLVPCHQDIGAAFKSVNLELLHLRVVKLLKVDLVTLRLGAAWLTRTRPVIEIVQARVVTKTADEAESMFLDAFYKGACRKVSVFL